MRIAIQVVLSAEERAELEKLAQGRKFPVRVVERARIVLFAAEGKQNREIAELCAVTRRTVSLWRRRFVEKRIAGILKDAPRAGRRRRIGEEVIQEIVRKTTQETPKGRTHWSTRSLAKAMGLSPSTIGRVVEEAWPEAAFVSHFQVESRSEVPGEIGRCHRSVCEPARTRDGVLGG